MILNHSERAYRKTAVRPLAAFSTATQKIKVLLDFFQKIAESRGSASGRPPQRAKLPPVATGEIPAGRSQRNARAAHGANSHSVPKRHPQMAQPPAKGHGPRRRPPTGGGRRGPFIPLGVGAGIPDGPGRNAPWTRQGCRVLRNGYAFAPMRRSTSPGTARRHTQVPPYILDS